MKDEIKEKMTIGKAKKILRGFLAKDCYYDTPLYYAIPFLLDYITDLQEENNKLEAQNELLDDNRIYLNNKIGKAIEIYKNRNTCKYKKERFMEDRSTSDLMYETLTGGNE